MERIAKVNVSHRVERKVRGALHEETLYGPTKTEGEWVVRKSLADLSSNEIDHIRDKTIRKLVANVISKNGIEFGRGKKPDKKKMKEVLSKLTMPSGVPIKKVRIIKPEQTIRPVREGQPGEAYVKPGSTHHLCIFEWEEKGKTKRDAVFVTMLEATERLKKQQQELAIIRKELVKNGLTGKKLKSELARRASKIAKAFPLIQRIHLERPEARFVMSLSIGEMVLANVNGTERLLKLRTSISTRKNVVFQFSEDSRRDYREVNANRNTLFEKYSARKVTVDPLGRIRWAND